MNAQSERRFIHFWVNCPLYEFSKWKMGIELVWNGEKWVPLLCEGCDMMGGDPICQKCCAALTYMFFDDPDLDVSQPVSPRIWELIDSKLTEDR